MAEDDAAAEAEVKATATATATGRINRRSMGDDSVLFTEGYLLLYAMEVVREELERVAG